MAVTAQNLAVDVLIAFGVAVELLCSLGVLLMRTAFDRLHYLGPAILFGPLCFAIATMIAGGPLSQQGIKTLIVFIVLLVTGPIQSYVTARLIRYRLAGDLALRRSDRIQTG